jgi:hypothetical protein
MSDFVEDEVKWSRDLYYVTVTHELNILVIMDWTRDKVTL